MEAAPIAAVVAAATRDDADALATLDKAARGDDDALCEALATHLRRELAREAPPPPINNASDFPALPATKKKRVRATLITDAPPAHPHGTSTASQWASPAASTQTAASSSLRPQWRRAASSTFPASA